MNHSALTLFLGLLLLAPLPTTAQEPNTKPESSFSGAYFGQQPPDTIPELFGRGIASTPGYDITPTFSPTLDEVFLGRRPTEQGADNRIYYSQLLDGVWSEPVLASFSSGAMEFEAQFSCDGSRVYYNRGSNLCFAEKTESGWSDGKPLDDPVASGMCPAIARNGNLYFTAARRPGGYGIWRAESKSGEYAESELVIPLAAHPFVAPDESYILMDKYGEGRTSKLYVSFPNNDGAWTEPVELSDAINATGTELIAKVSPDGKYLFFQRKVSGNTDIYWVNAEVIRRVAGGTSDE